jgi:hypothetical protein
MATAVMQDREYENEEALRSLVTNHQRIRSPALRRVKSSERYLPFIIVRPMMATMMASDVVSMTPIQQLWQSLLIWRHLYRAGYTFAYLKSNIVGIRTTL